MIVLDKIAKRIFQVPGIARVQNITRPLGDPIAHSSIPFQVSMQSVSMTENLQFLKNTMADMLTMTDQLGIMVATMKQMQALTSQMADTTHRMLDNMKEMKATTDEMRDHLADFDDFFRPLRNYFYWEPHCYDIPICYSIRSVFDTLDGIDTMTDDIQNLMPLMDRLDSLMPQLV